MMRIEVLQGEHKGKVFDAEEINVRPYPNCPDELIDLSLGDGVWVHELGLRFKHDFHNPTYKNLVAPFDRFNKEIFVGDAVYVSRDKKVTITKVLKFGGEYHVGCGWMQRVMTLQDVYGKQDKFTFKFPSYCIKIED